MAGGLVLQSDVDDQAFYRINLMAHELFQHAGIPLIQMSPAGSADGADMPTRVRRIVTRLLLQIAGQDPDTPAAAAP
jgi:hypothetical protein